MKDSKNTEVKEEFCGACVAGAVALAGAGAAGAGAGSKTAHKLTKKILIGVGVTTFVIAVVVGIILWKKNCAECR